VCDCHKSSAEGHGDQGGQSVSEVHLGCGVYGSVVGWSGGEDEVGDKESGGRLFTSAAIPFLFRVR
jgi:hypothetical protein